MRGLCAAALVGILILLGCGGEKESPLWQKAYDRAAAEQDPVMKIAALRTWLADFPEAAGADREKAVHEIWRTFTSRHEDAAAIAWARMELDAEPSVEGKGALYSLLFNNAKERGSRDAALQIAQRLWDSGIVHAPTLNQVGWALVGDPGWNPDLGARLAERGVDAAEPGYERASIMDTAGWGYFLLGRKEPARRLLEGALREVPELDREIAGHLAVLYERSGEETPLLDLWTRMLRTTMDSRMQSKAESLHVKAGGDLTSYRESLWQTRMEKAELAPDFELIDLEGRTHRLSDYRGKVVMLNFWHPT